MIAAMLVLVACGGSSQAPLEQREGFLTLSVSGMTCPRCEAVVQREVATIDGVISVMADNEANTVVVEHEPNTDLDAIRRVIILEGFTVN